MELVVAHLIPAKFHRALWGLVMPLISERGRPPVSLEVVHRHPSEASVFRHPPVDIYQE